MFVGIGAIVSSAGDPAHTYQLASVSAALEASYRSPSSKLTYTNTKATGPAWTYDSSVEKPAGEKNMGNYVEAVYTEDQEERLGVDEYGNKVGSSGGGSTKADTGGGAAPPATPYKSTSSYATKSKTKAYKAKYSKGKTSLPSLRVYKPAPARSYLQEDGVIEHGK